MVEQEALIRFLDGEDLAVGEFFETIWKTVATAENEEGGLVSSPKETRREYYLCYRTTGINATEKVDSSGVHRMILINQVIPGNAIPETFAMQHTTRDAKYRVAMKMPLDIVGNLGV